MTVMTVGGTIRPIERSIYGSTAERALAEFNFDTFIMSSAGIDMFAGLTEFNPDDAAVKRAALASARRTIAVADGSKMGAVTFSQVCRVPDIDIVVTDREGFNSDTLRAARADGLRVVCEP
jgi:DeoR/GlpR family transcriptional regulator of sugar metabolism